MDSPLKVNSDSPIKNALIGSSKHVIYVKIELVFWSDFLINASIDTNHEATISLHTPY